MASAKATSWCLCCKQRWGVCTSSVGVMILWLLLFAVKESSYPADPPPSEVSVQDGGPQYIQSNSPKHSGHKWENRSIALDNGLIRYTFRYGACVDPTHGDQRFYEEGYLGMPGPCVTNWYHSGFMFVSINGKDIGDYRLSDMRPLETGPRGSFLMIWEHPDAVVQLKLMLPAGANHVLADLSWKPRPQATINSITVRLICYPSYFTSWNHRQGDRHCETPRINEREPKTLVLDPEKDNYLYFYDTIFDVAKGEGDGPCAMSFVPDSIKSGQVSIGGYAVITNLVVKPEAQRVRMAFYDFGGKKNAEADTYLKAKGVADQTELAQIDFRPEAVCKLDITSLRTEIEKYLKDAGDDAKPYRQKAEQMLTQITDLKKKSDEGDGRAEVELSTLLSDLKTLMWKVKILALLNG